MDFLLLAAYMSDDIEKRQCLDDKRIESWLFSSSTFGMKSSLVILDVKTASGSCCCDCAVSLASAYDGKRDPLGGPTCRLAVLFGLVSVVPKQGCAWGLCHRLPVGAVAFGVSLRQELLPTHCLDAIASHQ